MIINKSLRFSILYLLLFSFALIFATYRLPAYASRLPWLIVLAFSDLYLMRSFLYTNLFKNNPSKIAIIFTIVFPSLLIFCFSLSMAFLSPVDWNPTLRTYLLGFAVLFYIIRIFPLLVFIFDDIRKLTMKRTGKKFVHSVSFFLQVRLSLGLSLVTAITIVFGMTFWVYDFEVVEKQIPIKGLPQVFDGYCIVHISDLHLGRWHSVVPLQRAFDLVNAQHPDLIAFTGDLVNYATSEALCFKEVLAQLKAKDGIYAVLGNHDYGDYMRWPNCEAKEANMKQMYGLMREINWVLLDNEQVKIVRYNGCLNIFGTGNYSTTSHYSDRANIELALTGVSDSCCNILLTHNPKLISNKKIAQHNPFDLILSGHTHGLQSGIKIYNQHYSPAAFAYKHWGGLYEFSDAGSNTVFLYVNRGLGHIAFPFRIGMRPEITVLTLKSV